MTGPELLKALLASAGENPYRIATRLKNPPLQSYVSKFITGKVKEPRRDSLRPIADHYGVPLEAFYDPAMADQVAAERGLVVGARAEPRARPPKRSSKLAEALDVLVAALQVADKDKLIAVRGWLSAMAEDPTTAKNKSDLILQLLVTDADKPYPLPHDGARGTGFSVTTPREGFGDEGHGRRDTNAATGGDKK